MRFDLSIDGRDHSGEYLLLEVLNFSAAGLDVVLVDEGQRRDLADHLSLSQIPTASTPALSVYQGRQITLSCGSCDLHLDDKVWPKQQSATEPIVVDLSVEPKALTFLVRTSVHPNGR